MTFGIVRTDTLGWGSPGVLAPLALGVALLAAFMYVEARVAPAPLVPLSIFRIRRLRAANLIVVLLYAANFPAFFFVTLYLQQVLHYSAIEAGLAFLPWTLSIFTGSTLAPRAVARFGTRPVITAAMLASAAGMALFTGIAPGQTYAGGRPGGSPPDRPGHGLHARALHDRGHAGRARRAERRGLRPAQHQPADGRSAGARDPVDDRQQPDGRRGRASPGPGR